MNLSYLLNNLIEFSYLEITPDESTLNYLKERSTIIGDQLIFRDTDERGHEYSITIDNSVVFLSEFVLDFGENSMSVMRSSVKDDFTTVEVSGSEDFVYSQKMSERPKVKLVRSDLRDMSFH